MTTAQTSDATNGLQIDRDKPVMVTGATGYVAGWVVRRLLEEGLTVHATVRDPNNKAKLKYLREAAEGAPGTLKFFKADLLTDGAFADAMAGCGIVFHTASPFKTDISDPQKELVDPAKLGTRNVLEEADRTDSVERVVLTSSCAAIYGDSADLHSTPRGVFTEEVWNTSSSLEHQPYSYSKTVAEKEAWKIADAQSRWRLVVVNPSLVMGPGLNPNGTSESYNLIRQMGDGTMKMGAPDMSFGVVDVRDLAEGHLRAAFTPDAEGRHILSGHNASMMQMVDSVRADYGDRLPLPTRLLPKWLLWLVGPILNAAMTRQVVSRNIGHPWKADNSKSREALGMTYRPLGESIGDFLQQMIDSGQLPKR